MKKIGIFLLILGINDLLYAGLNGPTYHSRANCAGFNESISWDATHSWNYRTISEHWQKLTKKHRIDTGWHVTRRSAAYHFPEGTSGWSVSGEHWIMLPEWVYPQCESREVVNDCSVYDGWWDKK